MHPIGCEEREPLIGTNIGNNEEEVRKPQMAAVGGEARAMRKNGVCSRVSPRRGLLWKGKTGSGPVLGQVGSAMQRFERARDTCPQRR